MKPHPGSPNSQARKVSLVLAGLPLLLLLLLLGGGCATSGGGSASSRIRQLYLVTTPVALNLDSRPGVDGLGASVFAFGPGPKAVPLKRGRLEITVYDPEGILEQPPRAFHQWSFEADELGAHRTKAAIGVGYKFLLSWQPKSLVADRIAVVCRYHPPEGPPVTSDPSLIGVEVGSRRAGTKAQGASGPP